MSLSADFCRKWITRWNWIYLTFVLRNSERNWKLLARFAFSVVVKTEIICELGNQMN